MTTGLGDSEIKRIEAEENLVIDAQYLIQGILNEKGMTRSDLARLAGISKARLTQMMRADANPTLRTLARLLAAVDEGICLARKPKCVADGGYDGWVIEPSETIEVARASLQRRSFVRATCVQEFSWSVDDVAGPGNDCVVGENRDLEAA